MRHKAANSNGLDESMLDALALLRAHARQMVGDLAAADDLVEKTLKRAIADANRRPGNVTLFRWLYGILIAIETNNPDP